MLARLLLILIVLLGLATPALAGDTYVRGYTRRDGTYVAPHWRSAPDSSFNNNWSTSPNVSPYTGETGTRTPRVEPFGVQPFQPVQPFGTQPRSTSPWGR